MWEVKALSCPSKPVQTKLFRCNQKALYKELCRKERSTQVPLSAKEANDFWSKLWDNLVRDKNECLKEVELKLENVNIQENVEITKEDATKQLRKMTQGLDGTEGFWLKRVISQHQRLTEELNENMNSFSIPRWLVKRRTVLIQKDPAKGNTILTTGQ